MKPRILFIGSLPPPYMGPTLATEILLNSSLSERFQLIHLDTSDNHGFDALGRIDFTNIFLAARHYLEFCLLMLKYRPDLVYLPHNQCTVPYLRDSVFFLLARLFRRKIVCHLRGGNFRNWYESLGPALRWYVYHVHRLADAQIVLGRSLRSLFTGLIPDERIFVVPNGRDFPAQMEPANRRDSDVIQVLYLANFIRSKGALDLLHAAALIGERRLNVRFILAGQWAEAEFRRDIEDFLDGHPGLPITIAGPAIGDDKYSLLANSDIFVFPTYYPPEGHPWVLIEAMAAGLPIITTDQGAITETVIDGENGFIVDKRRPQAIADRVAKLAGDRELRQAMGRRSRARYAAQYREKNMVTNMAVVFDAVLGTGTIPGSGQ